MGERAIGLHRAYHAHGIRTGWIDEDVSGADPRILRRIDLGIHRVEQVQTATGNRQGSDLFFQALRQLGQGRLVIQQRIAPQQLQVEQHTSLQALLFLYQRLVQPGGAEPVGFRIHLGGVEYRAQPCTGGNGDRAGLHGIATHFHLTLGGGLEGEQRDDESGQESAFHCAVLLYGRIWVTITCSSGVTC
ncbi:hypothetical protein D9M70_357660 [compost metagenome]